LGDLDEDQGVDEENENAGAKTKATRRRGTREETPEGRARQKGGLRAEKIEEQKGRRCRWRERRKSTEARIERAKKDIKGERIIKNNNEEDRGGRQHFRLKGNDSSEVD